uniref:Integrase catalytic domain-containing protein n=1 Tax=Tanacetum cinerariifolium TaxID=118510 RepID=A0A699GS31_TANCI|nr:hypothetical protein [Tanacetum cinerariifolium]
MHLLFMQYEQERSRKGTKGSRNRNPNWLLGVKIKRMERISSLMLPSPRFPLHPRGKILIRTQYVINAMRHVIGRGTVLNGQSTEVDAPPDIIDVVDEDDAIIDDEDALPHDLADSDDEDLINMSADVARSHGGNGGGEDRPPPHHVPTGCEDCFANRGTLPEPLKIGKTGQRARSYLDRDLGHLFALEMRWRVYVQRQSSTTQEYRSLIDTFFMAHIVNGVFTRDEDCLIYEEMRRLEATSTYTDDEINRVARMGKQRGHIPGVGRVLPAQFESAGANGSGGSGDDEDSVDDQEDEDEDGDGDNHHLILMPEFSPRVTPEARLTRVVPLCVGATPHQWPKISSDTGRLNGPTPITSINQTNTNADYDGPPDLQDQILSHISSLKALVKKHNESLTGLLKPIRLSFDNEGGPEEEHDEELEDLRKPYKEDVPATLDGPARGWFDRLPNGCIDNWMDLREAFVERFALRRKCCKDPTEVAKIISAFLSNSKCPELARRFSDQVSQTVTEMMRRVDDFVKSEEVFKNTELLKGEHPDRPAITQFRGSHPPRHSYGSRPSRADIYRRGDHYQPYITPRAPDRRYDNRRREVNHLRLDSLTKRPSEILAIELQLRLPPCPPTLEIVLKSGKLNHLIKDVRQRGGDRGRQTGNNNGRRKVINMVWQSNNGLKRKSLYKKFEEWMDVPITFPPVSKDDVSDGPLIVEAEVEGHWIRRVFVDQGAAVQVMFEHCFDNLSSDIKARLASTQTEAYRLARASGNFIHHSRYDEVSNTKRNRYHMRPGKADILVPMVGKKCGETRGNGGVPRRLVRNALNVNHSVPLVTQKQRVLGTEKSKVVKREVEEWVKARIVRPVKYPTWISNLVLVKKADNTWRMCIDFKNLNTACPKDYFPLPEIDLKIKAIMRHPFKCFLDAYKGYYQIQMSEEDEDKQPSIQTTGPFQTQLGRNLEAYVDDMVIMSKTEQDMVRGAIPHVIQNTKNITKENKEDYRWIEEAEHAFQELKKFILELPTLTTLELKETLFVYLATSHDVVKTSTMPTSPILKATTILRGSPHKGAYNITYIPRTAVKGQILADFIKEIPTGTQHIEACNLAEEEDSKGWTLYTDGASSQKGVRAGLILIDPSGTEYTYAIRLPSTNNEAEYEALLAGLRIARNMKVQTLDVKKSKPKGECAKKFSFGRLQPSDEGDTSRSIELKVRGCLGGPLQVNYIIMEVHEGACGMHAGARFGLPRVIVADNRTQLVNDPFKSWCEKWKIKHMNTPVVHPQANGLVERANKSLMHGLKARLERERNEEEMRLNLDLSQERKETTAIREAKYKKDGGTILQQKGSSHVIQSRRFRISKERNQQGRESGKVGSKLGRTVSGNRSIRQWLVQVSNHE